jgi:hypothetical protein
MMSMLTGDRDPTGRRGIAEIVLRSLLTCFVAPDYHGSTEVGFGGGEVSNDMVGKVGRSRRAAGIVDALCSPTEGSVVL